MLLGRPWIHAYKCVPSALHQCTKAYHKGKEVTIRAAKTPFARNETNFAEAALFDELADERSTIITQPRGWRLPQWREYEYTDNPDLVSRRKQQKVEKIFLLNGRSAYRLDDMMI